MKINVKKSFSGIFKSICKCQQYIANVYHEYTLHRSIIRKFKDPRRVKIYSKINLSQSQKQEIDNFFLDNYGKKLPYTWHRHFTAFTGKFDINYFPELLYIPEFEYYLHARYPHHTKVVADKNIISYLAQAVGVCVPKVLLCCVDGIFRKEDGTLLNQTDFKKIFGELGECFIKPSLDSSSGNKCAVLNMQAGKDTLTGKAVENLLKEYGDNFIVQKRLVCHEALSKIYSHSVNTFRIITYRWKENILHTPIILRIGQGGHVVDNAHAGGIFIAVEDDGTLHKTAFTEFNTQYTQHPDTHVIFEGYKIPNVHKVIEAALRMHAFLPWPGIYNWDFTLNKQGEPVLIEANTGGGSIWLIQIAHGKGVFGNKTAEILQWLRFMKHQPYEQRKFYKPGYTVK